jgi:hypothetical protein
MQRLCQVDGCCNNLEKQYHEVSELARRCQSGHLRQQRLERD